MAFRKPSESSAVTADSVAIRKLSGPSRDAELWALRQEQGKHFVSCIEACRTEYDLYIVLVSMPISLIQIVAATVQPGETHVMAILAQAWFPSTDGVLKLTHIGSEWRSVPRFSELGP